MKTVGTPVTISNIVNDFNNEYSIPKISALVKQLKDNEIVTREEIKRVAYFKINE
jgi:DNA-binding transcriptional regulator GbsR (MarR family)